jgi:hypothetical protein
MTAIKVVGENQALDELAHATGLQFPRTVSQGEPA